MRNLTKNLAKYLLVLTTLSVFSLSGAAASACDGMKDHARSGDSQANPQAKNEKGKGGTKSGEKSGEKSRTEDGANKS